VTENNEVMKKIILLLVLVIFVSVAIFALMGHSVVVYQQEAPARDYEFKTGQKVNPLADFNFDEGSWTAFVVFSNDDRPHLPASIENCTVIRYEGITGSVGISLHRRRYDDRSKQNTDFQK